jgi:hypothetical protein
MNKKIDFRKIGIAILGLFAILTALMRGSDIFPMPENTQTEQSTAQVVDTNTNVEVVEFDLNKKEETGEKDHTKPRNVEDDSNPGNQRLTYGGKDLILTKHAKC